MDIRTTDTSVPRARQLRDEPQSGRYPTRGYQQRQPSLERGAADQTDLKNEEPGKSGLRTELTNDEAGEVCPVDRRQPYQRLGISRGERISGAVGRMPWSAALWRQPHQTCMRSTIVTPAPGGQASVDWLRLGVEIPSEKRVDVLKRLQGRRRSWRSRQAAIEGKADAARPVRAHFHGLAGGPQLGNEHCGIELIESGGGIALHNQDWRSNSADFFARQLLILRRVRARVIRQACTISRFVSRTLLGELAIEESGEQHCGGLFRGDGGDVSRGRNLQSEVASTTTSKDDDAFRVNVWKPTHVFDGRKRVLARDARLWILIAASIR